MFYNEILIYQCKIKTIAAVTLNKLVRLSLYYESLLKTNCSDLNEIKSKLFKLMETTWLIDMHNKPKLRRYITFKTTLIVFNHVKQYISKPRRRLIIQLITGILPIFVETIKEYEIL